MLNQVIATRNSKVCMLNMSVLYSEHFGLLLKSEVMHLRNSLHPICLQQIL